MNIFASKARTVTRTPDNGHCLLAIAVSHGVVVWSSGVMIVEAKRRTQRILAFADKIIPRGPFESWHTRTVISAGLAKTWRVSPHSMLCKHIAESLAEDRLSAASARSTCDQEFKAMKSLTCRRAARFRRAS